VIKICPLFLRGQVSPTVVTVKLSEGNVKIVHPKASTEVPRGVFEHRSIELTTPSLSSSSLITRMPQISICQF